LLKNRPLEKAILVTENDKPGQRESSALAFFRGRCNGEGANRRGLRQLTGSFPGAGFNKVLTLLEEVTDTITTGKPGVGEEKRDPGG
jgi:hypothetical protein